MVKPDSYKIKFIPSRFPSVAKYISALREMMHTLSKEVFPVNIPQRRTFKEYFGNTLLSFVPEFNHCKKCDYENINVQFFLLQQYEPYKNI